MSSALHRRLNALRRMTEANGCTPGEAASALEAAGRIRLRLAQEGLEELGERPETYQPQRRTRRDKRPKPPQRMHVGDVIDATGTEGTFRYCACGGSRWQVEEGTPPMAVAWLRCVGCSRARKLSREDFSRQ